MTKLLLGLLLSSIAIFAIAEEYSIDIPISRYALCENENFTSDICANYHDANIKFKSQGSNKTELIIRFTPTYEYDNEKYVSILTLPYDVKVTNIEYMNMDFYPMLIDQPSEDQVPAIFSAIGNEALSNIFNSIHSKLGFIVSLFFGDIESTGDPAYINELDQEGYTPILDRQFYPHITYAHLFTRLRGVSSMMVVNIDKPLHEVLELIRNHRMGLYVGGNSENELLIDGLKFQYSENDLSNIKIKRSVNPDKGVSVGGKLTWNPRTVAWERQVVLYNNVTVPAESHAVWKHTLSITPPSRPGVKDWESIDYRLFSLGIN